jgi:uncharacterized protein YndB with AHSA1/START domain
VREPAGGKIMSEPKLEEKKLVIEKQIEIAAPIERVWKAISEGNELVRWFPLEARVEPGAGGKISLSWGPDWEGSAPIDVWEPNKRLQWTQTVAGQPVVIEFTLELRGGKTMVRIVQSSFATGSDWENEYFGSTEYGWGFMLVNLRHYLERHAGVARVVAWPRFKVEMPRERIWEKLTAPGGIFRKGAGSLSEAERYSLCTATGEDWAGQAQFVLPPRGFCVTVDSFNDGLA